MIKQEILNLLSDPSIPDDAEVELNTIFDAKNESHLSPISEIHYDAQRNKVCITPLMISI